MGEKKTISTICNVLNGFAFKSDKYVSSGTRVIRITNVQKGYVVDDDPKYYPESEMSQLGQYVLRENDLLMSLTGNVGRVGLLTEDLLPAALNQRVACLRIKDSGVLLKYLFYYLNSDLFEKAAIFSASGIAQKNMSTEWLKKVEIPVPSIGEQQRIVDELDLLTGIIDKKNAQLRDLDTLAQSIFYEMFGDPALNEKDWPVVALETIAESRIGLTYKPENVCEEGTIVLRSSNIQESEIDLKDIVRVNSPIKENQYVQEGDILMCSRNGSFKLVGKVAKIGALPERMSYGAFMTTIRSKYNPYLFEFFKLPAFRTQLGLAKTATINQITVKMLANTKVALPPLELQKSFEKRVSSIYAQKASIKQSMKDCQNLLDSRMLMFFND